MFVAKYQYVLCYSKQIIKIKFEITTKSNNAEILYVFDVLLQFY